MKTLGYKPGVEVRAHVEHLDRLAKGKNPIADLLLEHGKEYRGSAFPLSMDRGPKKHCYKNALKLCYEHGELHYGEGYAVSAGLGVPLAHGWAVDPYGNVLDPTWDEPEKCDYFGIDIPVDVAGKITFHLEYYSVLGNLWRAPRSDPEYGITYDNILAAIRRHNPKEENPLERFAA